MNTNFNFKNHVSPQNQITENDKRKCSKWEGEGEYCQIEFFDDANSK